MLWDHNIQTPARWSWLLISKWRMTRRLKSRLLTYHHTPSLFFHLNQHQDQPRSWSTFALIPPALTTILSRLSKLWPLRGTCSNIEDFGEVLRLVFQVGLPDGNQFSPIVSACGPESVIETGTCHNWIYHIVIWCIYFIPIHHDISTSRRTRWGLKHWAPVNMINTNPKLYRLED